MTGAPSSQANAGLRAHGRIVRTIAIAAAILILIAVAVLAIRVLPLLLEPNRYAGTRSVEARADFRDPALMRRAWALPVAASYRVAGFQYQRNPSFCGPASVAMLLRSIGVATDQGKVIDDTQYEPWFGILLGGLTLDQTADLLALRLGRPVQVVREASLANFRDLLRSANDPRVRIIANFHRGPIFGRGHGHFSPILAYLPDRDLVLVGDVNAEYRPFLVSSDRLHRAIATIDDATGRERGLIVARIADRQKLNRPVTPQ